MKVFLSDLTESVRQLIDDNLLTDGRDENTYTNSSIFTIYESQAVSVSSVEVNGTVSGVTYTYNSAKLQVTISSSLSEGDSVTIYYTYYNKYSETEIKNKIKAAITILVARGLFSYSISGNLIVPEPTYKDRNLIAVITSILLEPNNLNYTLPDIKIGVPGSSLTTDEMIARAISLYKQGNNKGIFGILGGMNDARN